MTLSPRLPAQPESSIPASSSLARHFAFRTQLKMKSKLLLVIGLIALLVVAPSNAEKGEDLTEVRSMR